MKYYYLPILIFILILVACKPQVQEENKVLYVGSVMILDFYNGTLHGNSLQTAFDEINEAGGIIDGYKIKVDLRSSEPIGNTDRAQQALLAAENIFQIHEDNLIALISATSTGSKSIALEIGENNHIAVISGGSTANSNSNLSPYFHRTAPPDKYTAKILAQSAIRYNIKTISIAKEANDLFSDELAKAFINEYNLLGGQVLDTVSISSNDQEISKKINFLYSQNPDAVFADLLVNYVDFFNTLDKQIERMGLNRENLHFFLAVNSENILQQTPYDFLEGKAQDNKPRVIVSEAAPDSKNANYIHFLSSYRQRFSDDIVSLMPNFYDAAYIVAIAAEKAAANGNNPNNIKTFRLKLNEQIRKISNTPGVLISPQEGWLSMQQKIKNAEVNYEGASGKCDIDSLGDVISNYNISTIIKNDKGVFNYEIIENISLDK